MAKTGRTPTTKTKRPRGQLSTKAAKVPTRGRGRGAKRGSAGTRATAVGASITRGFPKLAGRDGCGALLMVGECVDRGSDKRSHTFEMRAGAGDASGRGAAGRVSKTVASVARAFGALGHVQRTKILAKLLEGPATYRAVQRVTKLKAGPLYHHINQLRLAGLILPKQRDLYELTRGGRNLILAAMVIGPLIRDKRRRPVARN